MNDPHPTVPVGFCHCGCGQKTKIAAITSRHAGTVKGEPFRYLHGHSGGGSRRFYADLEQLKRAHRALWDTAGIEYGLCLCGCGHPTQLASGSDIRRGWIRGEPRRFAYPHGPRVARKLYRFRVEDRGYLTPCWIWQLKLDRDGYGHEYCRGRDHPAHRVAWERANGPIPEGLHIDHLCRVRCCVNPDHLEPVTNAENIRRGSLATLTHADVRRIRALRAEGLSIAAVCRSLGLSGAAVWGVVRGISWRDVE